MFSMIPYVVDLSKKLVPGLWEKVQFSILYFPVCKRMLAPNMAREPVYNLVPGYEVD